MELGRSNVYLKQAGTGAAWMGPQSSFDPVAAAKYAGALKLAQQKQKQQKVDKEQLDFLNRLKVTGGKVLEEDFDFYNQVEQDVYNWAAGEVAKADKEGREPNLQQLTIQGQKKAANANNLWKRGTVQKERFDKFHQLILGDKSANPIYDSETMTKGEGIYTQPYRFLEDEQDGEFLQQTWLPMFEEAMRDPINQQNPERTMKEVTVEWRDAYGDEYLQPIYNPISLQKNFKDNIKPILAEFKNYKSVRDSSGNTITEEDVYTLPDNMIVTVEMEDGSTKEVELPGVRSMAIDNYETDVTVQRSAKTLFKNQDKSVKEDYINQFGEDAAKEWFADENMNWGLQATTKKINNAAIPKTGNSYRYGNKTYPFEVTLDEGTRNYNRLGVYNQGTEGAGIAYSYAQVPVRGVSFGSDKNKYPKIKVNPLRIFDQDSYSWMNSDASQEFDFTVAGVYEMPATTEQINLKDPKYAGILTWGAKTYGKKANTAIAKYIASGNYIIPAGTPVSGDEADIVNKIKKGSVRSQKFATGQISGYDKAQGKNFEIAGATIPYEEVQEQVELATNGNWSEEINAQYGGGDDWWKPKIKEGNQNTTAPNINIDPLLNIVNQVNTGGRQVLE
jgi:hypothetical protein